MQGILIGLCLFLLIGFFHSIVKKAEYHFIRRILPAFLLAGVLCLTGAYFVGNQLVSSILDVADFCCFWNVGELSEREERVKKGWALCNLKRDQE